MGQAYLAIATTSILQASTELEDQQNKIGRRLGLILAAV